MHVPWLADHFPLVLSGSLNGFSFVTITNSNARKVLVKYLHSTRGYKGNWGSRMGLSSSLSLRNSSEVVVLGRDFPHSVIQQALIRKLPWASYSAKWRGKKMTDTPQSRSSRNSLFGQWDRHGSLITIWDDEVHAWVVSLWEHRGERIHSALLQRWEAWRILI